MRVQYENGIYELMKKNERIVALVADSGTGAYAKIKAEMPERFIDFGIAENTMISCASGLASEGFIPVIYAINNFLVYRSYEFIRNDACIDFRNIKFVGLGAGVIQNMQGPTHHTLEDIGALRVLPNLTLLSPGSPKEVKGILESAIDIEGPVYIRLAKAYETEIYENEPADFVLGKPAIIHEGRDLTVLATGSIAGDASVAIKELNDEGFSIKLLNMTTLKPIDEKMIADEINKTGKALTIEEHNIYCGLGGLVAEIIVKHRVNCKMDMMGFPDRFCFDYGWHQDIKKANHLGIEDIKARCRIMLEE